MHHKIQHHRLKDAQESKRERLSAIVAGGGSRQYLGREVQLSDIDKMSTELIIFTTDMKPGWMKV